MVAWEIQDAMTYAGHGDFRRHGWSDLCPATLFFLLVM